MRLTSRIERSSLIGKESILTKKLMGIVLILVCAGCLFMGYTTYMEETEGARAVDDFAQSSGLSKLLPEDATKPEMPNNTKFALAGAAVTGIAGLVLVIKS